jgi:hypothetical protein
MYGSWTTLARISWPQKTRTGGRTDNLRDVVGLDVRADGLLHRRQGVEAVSGLGWKRRVLQNHQKGPMRLLGFHLEPQNHRPPTTPHPIRCRNSGHNTEGNLHHHHNAGASPLSFALKSHPSPPQPHQQMSSSPDYPMPPSEAGLPPPRRGPDAAAVRTDGVGEGCWQHMGCP